MNIKLKAAHQVHDGYSLFIHIDKSNWTSFTKQVIFIYWLHYPITLSYTNTVCHAGVILIDVYVVQDKSTQMIWFSSLLGIVNYFLIYNIIWKLDIIEKKIIEVEVIIDNMLTYTLSRGAIISSKNDTVVTQWFSCSPTQKYRYVRIFIKGLRGTNRLCTIKTWIEFKKCLQKV